MREKDTGERYEDTREASWVTLCGFNQSLSNAGGWFICITGYGSRVHWFPSLACISHRGYLRRAWRTVQV